MTTDQKKTVVTKKTKFPISLSILTKFLTVLPTFPGKFANSSMMESASSPNPFHSAVPGLLQQWELCSDPLDTKNLKNIQESTLPKKSAHAKFIKIILKII